MRKCFTIGIPELRKKEDGTEVAFLITKDGKEEELTFFVDSEYEKYIAENRCDAAAVALIQYAVRGGYDIECQGTLSSMLMYNLNFHLIPMLCASDSSLTEVQIKAEQTVDTVFEEAKGVATGISCGVDSFYTLYEYSRDDIPEEYRLTHLTYFKNGAHHGQIDRFDGELQNNIFNDQLKRVKDFCSKYGYKLIVIDSNLSDFIGKMFDRISYNRVHTFHSLSFAFLLPKLIGTYYYSSSGVKDYGEYKINLDGDTAFYDRISLPLLSTESFRAYSANRNATRLEKVFALSKFEQSYDWLLVCLKKGRNCGRCLKCERTLLELDATGTLDLYKNSFDIPDYKKRRHSLIKDVCKKGLLKKDVFYQDILEYVLENNPKWLDCLTEKDKDDIMYSVFFEKNAHADSYADDVYDYCRKTVPDWERCMSFRHRFIISLTKNKLITGFAKKIRNSSK